MDLTQGNIKKQLISMAVPAGIGMLFYTLYNVVDTFYAGLISTEALAGLAISFPVYFILLAFAVGFGQGTTALVSNLLGAKKEEDAIHLHPITNYFASFVCASWLYHLYSFRACLYLFWSKWIIFREWSSLYADFSLWGTFFYFCKCH